MQVMRPDGSSASRAPGAFPNMPSIASGGTFGAQFAAACAVVPTSAIGSPSASACEAASNNSSTTDITTALAAFEKEAHKTPAERAHDQILEKHHLTEAGYKALPPEQKKLIDQEIVERTKLLMKSAVAGRDGTVTAPTFTSQLS